MSEALNQPSDDEIRRMLEGMKRVAVVGISAKEDRASHGIARFLIGKGLDVIGVNPVLDEVLGVKVHPSLNDIQGPVDLVDVFRKSDAVPAIVDDAIANGAGGIWLQEGVVHEAAAEKARAAGLFVIQDRCIYKEWLRLMNA